MDNLKYKQLLYSHFPNYVHYDDNKLIKSNISWEEKYYYINLINNPQKLLLELTNNIFISQNALPLNKTYVNIDNMKKDILQLLLDFIIEESIKESHSFSFDDIYDLCFNIVNILSCDFRGLYLNNKNEYDCIKMDRFFNDIDEKIDSIISEYFKTNFGLFIC